MYGINRNGYFPGIIIAILVLLAGCKRSPEFRVIEIRGADAVYNISRSWIHFGSNAVPGGTVSIAAGNGDLLYALDEDHDRAVFLVCDKNLGSNPELSFDINYPAAVYLDGILHAVNISLDSLPPALPHRDGMNGLSNVNSLYLKLPLGNRLSAWLETSFDEGNIINLVIDGEDKSNQLAALLNRFNPQWVYMPELNMPHSDDNWHDGLKSTRLLIASHSAFGSDNIYQNLGSLVSLILPGNGDDRPAPVLFSEIPELKSLTVMDVSHVDMSWFDGAVKLESLFLINVDSISSQGNSEVIQRLKAFGLTESDWDGELPDAPLLRWISLPGNLSQGAFDRWCSRHRDLEAMEITGNRMIDDLQSLQYITGLKKLMIDVPQAPLHPLAELKQLELLVIEQDRYNESDVQITALKEALPRTRIVPGGGFCLGSGWILILIPFLMLMLFTGKKRKGAGIRIKG